MPNRDADQGHSLAVRELGEARHRALAAISQLQVSEGPAVGKRTIPADEAPHPLARANGAVANLLLQIRPYRTQCDAWRTGIGKISVREELTEPAAGRSRGSNVKSLRPEKSTYRAESLSDVLNLANHKITYETITQTGTEVEPYLLVFQIEELRRIFQVADQCLEQLGFLAEIQPDELKAGEGGAV